jgi:hypothetical protein
MKKLSIVVLAIVMAMGIGCAGTKHIGTIGDVEFHEVYSTGILTPSTTTIVTKNPDGAVAKVNGGMGGSGVGQLAAPVATVGAAYLIKEGMGDIRPDTYTDNSQTVTASGAASGSVAGAAAVNSNKNSSSSKSFQAQGQGQAQGQLQGQSQTAKGGSGSFLPPGHNK